jgi:hypothetical protein
MIGEDKEPGYIQFLCLMITTYSIVMLCMITNYLQYKQNKFIYGIIILNIFCIFYIICINKIIKNTKNTKKQNLIPLECPKNYNTI